MSGTDQNLIALADLVKGSRKKAAVAPALPGADADEDDTEEKCACGKSLDQTKTCKKGASCEMKKQTKSAPLFIPISKASDEEQTVTGVVLQPEVTDAQGDIYDATVIKAAAYDFLANYNKATKLGKQHNDFKAWQERFALVESYLAPIEFVMGTNLVKLGSWIMTVKVLDPKIWALVKAGKITGFSIGGKAKVKNLIPTVA